MPAREKVPAALWQDGRHIGDAAFTRDEELDELLTAFVSREPEEVREFKKAVETFKGDIPPSPPPCAR